MRAWIKRIGLTSCEKRQLEKYVRIPKILPILSDEGEPLPSDLVEKREKIVDFRRDDPCSNHSMAATVRFFAM